MEESFEGVKRGRIVTKQRFNNQWLRQHFVVVTVQRLSQLERTSITTTAQIAMQQGESVAKSIKPS